MQILVSDACRCLNAVYSAIGMGTTVPLGTTAFVPTVTLTTLYNSKSKLEVPIQSTGKLD